MAVNVEEKIGRLSPELRRQVEKRAEELIAEEMTLRGPRTPRVRPLPRETVPGASRDRLQDGQ